MESTFDTIIVGGGITGLATAYYLRREAQLRGQLTRILLLEASNRVGGKIGSEIVQKSGRDFLLENGPDSFLTSKPWAFDLVKELGIEHKCVPANTDRVVHVFKKDRLIPMPKGLSLIVPTRIWPFLTTPLISWRGKLRAGCDLILPRRKNIHSADESIGHFVQRRLGDEILEFIAEPLLCGIYNADPFKQSSQACFPQLIALEQKYRSLIVGVLRSKNKAPGNAALFVSFQDGMQSLVDALQESLSGTIQTNVPVQSVSKHDGQFQITLVSGKTYSASRVLLTTPARQCAELLMQSLPSQAQQLSNFPTQSSGFCYFAYRNAEIPRYAGVGVLIPKSANRRINAITFVSQKLQNRSPEGFSLLRVFFGGARNPEMLSHNDQQLIEIARRELKDILGIHAKPLFGRVSRFENENHQYHENHFDDVKKLQESLPDGLFVAGSSFLGLGIPDCVHQAKNLAKQFAKEMYEQ